MLPYDNDWIIRFGESDIVIGITQYKAVFGLVYDPNNKREMDTYVNVYKLVDLEYEHIGSNWITDLDGGWGSLNEYLVKNPDLKTQILSLAKRYEKLKAFA
jgi:hypothetical protein